MTIWGGLYVAGFIGLAIARWGRHRWQHRVGVAMVTVMLAADVAGTVATPTCLGSIFLFAMGTSLASYIVWVQGHWTWGDEPELEADVDPTDAEADRLLTEFPADMIRRIQQINSGADRSVENLAEVWQMLYKGRTFDWTRPTADLIHEVEVALSFYQDPAEDPQDPTP